VNTTTRDSIDTLGKRLAHDALTTLIRLYPAIREATEAQQEAACAAMRAISRPTLDTLIDDARDVPGLAQVAYQTAVLTMAHEGIKVLKGGPT
jgi:hypothetical protein